MYEPESRGFLGRFFDFLTPRRAARREEQRRFQEAQERREELLRQQRQQYIRQQEQEQEAQEELERQLELERQIAEEEEIRQQEIEEEQERYSEVTLVNQVGQRLTYPLADWLDLAFEDPSELWYYYRLQNIDIMQQLDSLGLITDQDWIDFKEWYEATIRAYAA